MRAGPISNSVESDLGLFMDSDGLTKVFKSDLFAYRDGKNITMEALQEALTRTAFLYLLLLLQMFPAPACVHSVLSM